jgi:hypothetical protein
MCPTGWADLHQSYQQRPNRGGRRDLEAEYVGAMATWPTVKTYDDDREGGRGCYGRCLPRATHRCIRASAAATRLRAREGKTT